MEPADDSLWWLAAGPAVWAVHFGASWALVSVGCARLPEETVWAWLAGCTVAALGVLGGFVLLGWRRLAPVRRAAPDAGTAEARRRFLASLLLLLSVLGALGVLASVAAVGLVGGCR